MRVFLLLAIAGLGALGVFTWFCRLEREGKRMTTVLVIFGLVLFESWIYPNQSLMPAGLFHPVFGSGGGTGAGGVESGLSFRLPEILVPMALVARLLAGRQH